MAVDIAKWARRTGPLLLVIAPTEAMADQISHQKFGTWLVETRTSAFEPAQAALLADTRTVTGTKAQIDIKCGPPGYSFSLVGVIAVPDRDKTVTVDLRVGPGAVRHEQWQYFDVVYMESAPDESARRLIDEMRAGEGSLDIRVFANDLTFPLASFPPALAALNKSCAKTK